MAHEPNAPAEHSLRERVVDAPETNQGRRADGAEIVFDAREHVGGLLTRKGQCNGFHAHTGRTLTSGSSKSKRSMTSDGAKGLARKCVVRASKTCVSSAASA